MTNTKTKALYSLSTFVRHRMFCRREQKLMPEGSFVVFSTRKIKGQGFLQAVWKAVKVGAVPFKAVHYLALVFSSGRNFRQ